jgi:hypothetical protein
MCWGYRLLITVNTKCPRTEQQNNCHGQSLGEKKKHNQLWCQRKPQKSNIIPNTPMYGHRAQAFSDKSYPSVPTASPSPGP